jgi:mRNA interferase RelE/StbE
MPEAYRVVLAPAAVRQLRRVRGTALMALRGVILALADEPRPTGSRMLPDADRLWRVRVRIDGEPWRVAYQVRESPREVVVLRVARRDEATYRNLG